MIRSILYFVLGAVLGSALIFFYLTSNFESTTALYESTLKNSLRTYKYTYASSAKEPIETNVKLVAAMATEQMTTEDKYIAFALLNSATALTEITFQNGKTRMDLFSAYLILYSKIENNLTSSDLEKMINACNSYALLTDCSEKKVTLMLKEFSALKNND